MSKITSRNFVPGSIFSWHEAFGDVDEYFIVYYGDNRRVLWAALRIPYNIMECHESIDEFFKLDEYRLEMKPQ